jgi:hypothetical protein
VGVVVGRESGHTVVLTKSGTIYLEQATDEQLSQLADYDRPQLIARQLRELAAVPNSGDLLVFGAYRNGMVVNFEDHAGAHGGLGGVQAFPFMALPSSVDFSVSDVTDATELYERFNTRYWRRDIHGADPDVSPAEALSDA